MSTQRDSLSDDCPDCGQGIEIAAVDLSFFRKTRMLYVCPGCGLLQAEARSAVQIRLSYGFSALDRMLLIVNRSRQSLGRAE
jgi:predicted RNA-binding Zn-ribbon protein involved in translation (DUF1610 family)